MISAVSGSSRLRIYFFTFDAIKRSMIGADLTFNYQNLVYFRFLAITFPPLKRKEDISGDRFSSVMVDERCELAYFQSLLFHSFKSLWAEMVRKILPMNAFPFTAARYLVADISGKETFNSNSPGFLNFEFLLFQVGIIQFPTSTLML